MISYIIFIFSIFFVVAFVFFVFSKRKRQNNIKLLIYNWGKELKRHRNFYAIERYAAVDNVLDCHKLTVQTLSDIDIQNLFCYLDRTITTIGQQYLYSKLITPSLSISELETRGVNSDFFYKENKLRLDTQLLLQKLETKETGLVVDFFEKGKNSEVQKYETLLKILSVLAIISLILCWLSPKIAIGMIFLFGVNLMIHLISRHNNTNKLKSIKQVYELLKITDTLTKLGLPITFIKKKYTDTVFKKFRRTYHFLDFGIPTNDITGIIFYTLDLVKAFFLTEIHLLNFASNQITKNKDALNWAYVYIGQIEMALSTASIMSSEIEYCRPTFINNNSSISCHNAIHPLIKNCVPNSIQSKETNVFITGSNMSGKSTFLRTILINSILSQSFFLCFAHSFSIPILKNFSSIKISDSLQEDTSYYFKEVNIIYEMVINSTSVITNLFVIDEIFKGTNTIERISLAKAILNYLSSTNNIIIASSHDIELIKLLGNKFKNFHFTESISNNELHFDHTIKDGPITTRNAIKIIEIEKFPLSIVNEAKEIALNFNNNS